jgi:hypothetical protein
MWEHTWQDEHNLIDQREGSLRQCEVSDGNGIERSRQDAKTGGANAGAA